MSHLDPKNSSFWRRSFWRTQQTAAVVGLVALGWITLKPIAASARDEHDPSKQISLTFAGLQRVYQPQDIVSGSVAVHTDSRHFEGRVRIQVIDPDLCHSVSDCATAFDKTYTVSGRQHGTVSFRFPAPVISTYLVRATLLKNDHEGPQKQTTPAAEVRFGVRSADLAGVPDHILKGSIAEMQGDTLQATLEQGAMDGHPVEVSIPSGATISVSVHSVPVMSNGVQVPGIKECKHYIGQIVGTDGLPEYDSSVDFLIIDGKLSAQVRNRGHFGDPNESDLEDVFIDPLSDYTNAALPSQYLVYAQHDVVPTDDVGPALHLEPPSPIDSAVAAPADSVPAPVSASSHLLAASPNTQAAALVNGATEHSYTLAVSVYEHSPYYPNSKEGRLRILNRAMNQIRNEIQIVPKRYEPFNAVTVVSWVLTGWQTIDDSGYGDSCDANIRKFNKDYPDKNVVSVLFTQHGTDCGGIGFRPANSSYGPHAIVADGVLVQSSFASDPEDYRSIVLMQELGHNFDYDPSNYPTYQPSYDPHNAPQISKTWYKNSYDQFYNRKACSAMRGGYDCTYPVLSYHNIDRGPLTSLAQGIAQFIPEAQVFKSATLSPTGGAVRDISVSSNGDVWAIAHDQRIWKKNSRAGDIDQTNAWTLAAGQAQRIAVDPNGIPWVINYLGDVFRKVSANPLDSSYDFLPGIRARDIGIGANGDVWIIGLDFTSAGNGIFKWNSLSRQFERMATHFASRIAVDFDGNPWIVGNAEVIAAWDPGISDFVTVPGSGIDIAIGGSRNQMVVGLIQAASDSQR